jgi:hypothetical protein
MIALSSIQFVHHGGCALCWLQLMDVARGAGRRPAESLRPAVEKMSELGRAPVCLDCTAWVSERLSTARR